MCLVMNRILLVEDSRFFGKLVIKKFEGSSIPTP